MKNRIKTILYSIVFTSVAAVAISATPEPETSISNSILGGTHSKAACLARAKATIVGYLRIHGGAAMSRVDNDSWTVVGWNFEPGQVDVVVTCADAVAKDSLGNAYFSLHGYGENAQENVKLALGRLIKIWDLVQ